MHRRPPAQPTQTEEVEPSTHPAEVDEPAVTDPVEISGIQSFPASDPPQWWAGPPG